jgi:hypothetical protein
MTGAPGQDNLNARLDAQAIAEIRSSVGPSEDVAAKYGIDGSTVRQIRRKKTWRHVLVPAPVRMSVSVNACCVAE